MFKVFNIWCLTAHPVKWLFLQIYNTLRSSCVKSSNPDDVISHWPMLEAKSQDTSASAASISSVTSCYFAEVKYENIEL